MSIAQEAEAPAVSDESVPDQSCLTADNELPKPAAKKSQPKKRQSKKANTSKDESPADVSVSPKDSAIEADTPSSAEPRKAVAKTKKRSPSKKATAKTSNKKKKEAATDVVPPPTLLPAPINQQVANKVKQILTFIKVEDECESRLERDQDNRDLISVPYSSLISAIMRMQAQYEISQSLESCISDIQDVVVQYFKRNFGPTPDIDWVTFDASKTSTFEHTIQQKIAWHGLEDVNLLEIELEMFTKNILEKTGLFRDVDGARVDGERLLHAVASAVEENTSVEEDVKVSLQKEEDVDRRSSTETLDGE